MTKVVTSVYIQPRVTGGTVVGRWRMIKYCNVAMYFSVISTPPKTSGVANAEDLRVYEHEQPPAGERPNKVKNQRQNLRTSFRADTPPHTISKGAFRFTPQVSKL